MVKSARFWCINKFNITEAQFWKEMAEFWHPKSHCSCKNSSKLSKITQNFQNFQTFEKFFGKKNPKGMFTITRFWPQHAFLVTKQVAKRVVSQNAYSKHAFFPKNSFKLWEIFKKKSQIFRVNSSKLPWYVCRKTRCYIRQNTFIHIFFITVCIKFRCRTHTPSLTIAHHRTTVNQRNNRQH